MGQLRKAVFLIFALIYAVVAPFTVLYALGYIFNPIEQTLLQTGLISLQTEPSDAQVWVNGVLVKDKTPMVLRNLNPGKYDVQISLPGYKPWRRTVSIEPDRAFRYENILFFQDRFEPEVLGDLPVNRIEAGHGARKLIVLHGANASGLDLFDLDDKKILPLITHSRLENALVDRILFHPRENSALILLKKEQQNFSILARFENKVETQDVSYLFPDPIAHSQWNSDFQDSIFYLKDNILKRVNLDDRATYPSLMRSVRGFSLYARRLFVVDENNRFLELNEKGKLRETLLDDPMKSEMIFGKNTVDFYSIYFWPRESLFFLPHDTLAIFLSQSGRLVCNKLPYFLDDHVHEIAMAGSKPRMAYRKGSELWVVDFEQKRIKTFFENGPTPRLIYKGKQPLSHLSWFYRDQYLLFLEGGKVMAQDFETDEPPVELLSVSTLVPDVFIDEKRGFIYFADFQTGRLSRVKVFSGKIFP